MKKIVLSISALVVLSCSSNSIKKQEVLKTHLEPQIEKTYEIAPIETFIQEPVLKQKVILLQKRILEAGALSGKQKKLKAGAQKLHDEILNTYTHLKFISGVNSLHIPRKSKVLVSLDSYYLDGDKAAPVSNEVYTWKRKTEPLVQQILNQSSQAQQPSRFYQEMLWGLNNQTVWEKYPKSHQDIFLQIDSKAPLKLPTEAQRKISERSAYQDDVQIGLSLLQGEFYNYDYYQEHIQRLNSTEDLVDVDFLPIQDSKLFSKSIKINTADLKFEIYNPSNDDEVLRLSDYQLVPLRNDVQRLGVFFRGLKDPELFNYIEKVLFAEMTQSGLAFSPGLNDYIDLCEALREKDFLNPEWLQVEAKFLSGMAILANKSETFSYAYKVVHGPSSYLNSIFKKYQQVRKQVVYGEREELARKVKGIPLDWKVKISKASPGIEYVHPESDQMRIQVLPGNPKSNSKSPYVVVRQNSRVVSASGKVIAESAPEARIPLERFRFLDFFQK